MEAIQTAAKYINYFYNYGAINNNLEEAGNINIQGESVMELDKIAHDITMHYLRDSEQVITATSEELQDSLLLNPDGRYFVYFDPLDGSSNVKHSLPVGFVFGIGKKNLSGPEDGHLRAGNEYIASGMFVIPTGIFTFALKDGGTWSFVMDKTGVFIRPKRIFLPEVKKSWELCFNSSQIEYFPEKIHNWLDLNKSKYAFRYAGSMAVDYHRLLKNGGLFLYPSIQNHPKKNYPNGKLRLMYECNVVALIAQEANGIAVNDKGENILDIIPKDPHERTSIYVGNKELIDEIFPK